MIVDIVLAALVGLVLVGIPFALIAYMVAEQLEFEDEMRERRRRRDP